MRKNRPHPSYRYASSKHAGAAAGRELTLLLLKLLSGHRAVPTELFDSKKQYIRKMREMKQCGYLTRNNTLTGRGTYLLNEDEVWSLTIPQPKHWDGKWHMVLYDIPAKKVKQRDALRLRLKELGLALYQHSVWVYPFPLEDVVRKISDFYQISDCVLFAVAEKLGGEKSLKQKFKI